MNQEIHYTEYQAHTAETPEELIANTAAYVNGYRWICKYYLELEEEEEDAPVASPVLKGPGSWALRIWFHSEILQARQ